MQPTSPDRARSNPLVWPFAVAFAASCILFWWLPSILVHWWLGLDAPIEPKFIWISVGALATFIFGYLLPIPKRSHFLESETVFDRTKQVAYRSLLILSVPALLIATQFAIYRSGVHYNEGHGLSVLQQAVLYFHLFFGLLYVGAVADSERRSKQLILVIALTIAPRLLISLQWGRFFVAQAVVPILFIAMARRWVTVSLKRMVQVALLVLFILFVPALIRGDTIFGHDEGGNPQIVNYFGYMNSLILFQEDYDLAYPCPPLLLSLTAKIVPYSFLGVCTIEIGDTPNVPATLEQLLTHKYTDDIMIGVGSNYILELFLTGGLGAILIGSGAFGFSCRFFVALVGRRSLFAGIWAECLSRALFAPRGNLGYVYERIPSLVLATLAVVLLSWSFAKMGEPMTTSTSVHNS